MNVKDKAAGRLRTVLITVASVAIAAGAGVLCWYQLDSYENTLVDVFAQQQDQYVELAADELKSTKSADSTRFEKVIEAVSGSSSQYWTLSRGGELVFVKDVPETNRYRGISDVSYFSVDDARGFIEGLAENEVYHSVVEVDSKSYIASGTRFSLGKDSYSLCLLTGESVVTDHNAYLAARANLATTIGITLTLFIVAAIGLSLYSDRKSSRLVEAEADNSKLRKQVENLSSLCVRQEASDALAIVGAVSREDEASQDGGRIAMRRIYQFKFYLNASHFVFFNGSKGETHPHTWEFALKIKVRNNDDLVQFSTYEHALEAVFAPYQNKTINECEPFDTLLPTLENLVEVFSARLLSVVDELDADLLQVEGSETPTRSYMVSYER